MNASIVLLDCFWFFFSFFAWENLGMVSYMHSLLDNSAILFASLIYSKLLPFCPFCLAFPFGSPLSCFAYMSHISSYLRGIQLLKLSDCQRNLLSMFSDLAWIWLLEGRRFQNLLFGCCLGGV